MNYQTINRSLLIVVLLSLFATLKVDAQDIHFSQFYASPLTLNPALTGKMNGNYRLAAIYRNQWWSVTSFGRAPYQTPSASFDMPFFVGKKKMDAVGAGIMFYNDIENGGGFSRLKVMASVAYHKALDKKARHQLSIGVQGGFEQFQTDVNKGTFESEIRNGNAETLSSETLGNPNMSAGLFYNGAFGKKLTFYIGTSFFNLLRPEESFTGVMPEDSKLPLRSVVHTGFDIRVAKRISLLPGLLFMNQAKIQEFNGGINFGFHLGPDPEAIGGTTLFLGGWFRHSGNSDAAIAMAALEFSQFRIGVSYDFNVSDLNQAASVDNNSALELSLIYVGQRVTDNKTFLFCPRY